MSYRRWIPTLLVAGAMASLPALARVRVGESVVLDGMPLFRTQHGELYRVPEPGQPAMRIGRLPRRASALMTDDAEAWAVTTGRQKPSRVRLFRVPSERWVVERVAPQGSTIGGSLSIEGLAGSDSRYVYLLPDGRFDRGLRRLEPGHLDYDSGLQVLRTLNRGTDTWYLTRSRKPLADGSHALWLLHCRGGSQWTATTAGATAGTVRLEADSRNLFLLYEDGRILRFDRRTLRLAEDLSPMLRRGTVELFSADETSYWIVTRDDERHRGRVVWQVRRDVLDGGPFHAEAVPAAFAPLAVDGSHVWFGAVEQGRREPLIAVDKIDGTAQSYRVIGPHGRRWRAFWRGTGNAAEFAFIGTLVVVSAPIWLPVVLFNP